MDKGLAPASGGSALQTSNSNSKNYNLLNPSSINSKNDGKSIAGNINTILKFFSEWTNVEPEEETKFVLKV
jgi:hypothetical protein